MFTQPAILARAGLYTLGMMGSIAFVGATAKQEKYLYLGGPLLAGVAIVALSGLAPLVIPATAARTLLFTENIWLYGGLAVFVRKGLFPVQLEDFILTSPGRLYPLRCAKDTCTRQGS